VPNTFADRVATDTRETNDELVTELFTRKVRACGVRGVVDAKRGGNRRIGARFCLFPRRNQTASGETAHPRALAGAHRTLAFGTKVEVTNKHNGRTVVVRIIDRGPFVRGRVIDLTPAAAQILDFSGLTPVSITVVN
jgi:hypothetical protein